MAFMTGLPATQSAILDAMALVGRVAETNYGLVFDVRSQCRSRKISPTPTLGSACIRTIPTANLCRDSRRCTRLKPRRDGGDSLFADGFALRGHLRDIDRRPSRRLTRTPVPFLLPRQGR